MFDVIYATDLRYLSECWRLCGDAHCCSFARHKARFRLIGRKPFQELPLLPGEYEHLASRGWLAQFGEHEHKVTEVALHAGRMRVESIVSRRPQCACDQATRTTICRLYPLLPVFDVEGRVVGAESIGIYEVLEDLQGLPPACQVTSLPFEELQKFFTIANAIGHDPTALFYVMAYRVAKHHLRARLSEAREGATVDMFLLFERMWLRGKLMDSAALHTELNLLADQFQRRYGESFSL